MKLRQREWCHNCEKEVIFEFEECNGQQVIDCPNCGHKHYLELDDLTLLEVRMEMMKPGVRVCLPLEVPDINFSEDESIEKMMSVLSKIETREVLAVVDGKACVAPKPGDKTMKVVTNRRWGVDPSQRTT